MESIAIWVLLGAFVVLIVWAMREQNARRAADERRAVADAAVARLRFEHESAAKKAQHAEELAQKATAALRPMTAKLVEAAAEIAEQKARADRMFQSVETIGVERDAWNSAYHAAVTGHAMAQEMLMAELERMNSTIRMIEAHAKKTEPAIEQIRRLASRQVAPEIREVVKKYTETHDFTTGIAATVPAGKVAGPLAADGAVRETAAVAGTD